MAGTTWGKAKIIDGVPTLRESGITPQMAEDNGLKETKTPAGSRLVFPYVGSLEGRVNGFVRWKNLPEGKYDQSKGTDPQLYVPRNSRNLEKLRKQATKIVVVEGEKKAIKLASVLRAGWAAVALGGVWNIALKPKKGEDRFSTTVFSAFGLDLEGREVYVLFDSDKTTNPQVQQAETTLLAILGGMGAATYSITIPPGEDGGKRGADDWAITKGGPEALRKALEEAEPVEVEAGDFSPELQRTDTGNALLFAQDHGDSLRYCRVWRRWFVWAGTHWRPDDDDEPTRKVFETIRGMRARAAKISTKEDRKRFMAWVKTSESKAKIDSMLSLGSTIKPVAVSDKIWDLDRQVIACTNGTLDLRTGTLRPPDPADMISRCLPTAFDQKAKCPRWLEFLRPDFPGRQEADPLRPEGGGIQPHRVHQGAVPLLRPWAEDDRQNDLPGNPPRALRRVRPIRNVGTFLKKKWGGGIPNDVARMKGIRLVMADENEEGGKLAAGKVKQMTGGDTITARFMRAEFFDFEPEFTIWLGANHKPEISASDGATWRRLKLVPFVNQVPTEQADKGLKSYLREEELPGILAWAVAGNKDWRKSGLGTCPAVEGAPRSIGRRWTNFGSSWLSAAGSRGVYP